MARASSSPHSGGSSGRATGKTMSRGSSRQPDRNNPDVKFGGRFRSGIPRSRTRDNCGNYAQPPSDTLIVVFLVHRKVFLQSGRRWRLVVRKVVFLGGSVPFFRLGFLSLILLVLAVGIVWTRPSQRSQRPEGEGASRAASQRRLAADIHQRRRHLHGLSAPGGQVGRQPDLLCTAQSR